MSKNNYTNTFYWLETMKKLEDLILTYRDFPRKGIDFKDVLGIIQEPEVFSELI